MMPRYMTSRRMKLVLPGAYLALAAALALLLFLPADVAVGQSAEREICNNGTTVPNPEAYPRLVSDCIALLKAKDTLAGTATLNWSADTALSAWEGVRADWPSDRVYGLDLSGKGLDGSIPPELGDLRNLLDLHLHHNSLTGQIPKELGGLDNLEFLYLHSNQLSGKIPTRLGKLENLRVLSISENPLAGKIPKQLGNLGNLELMVVRNNQVTGKIPKQLGNLGKLRHLSLSGNQLKGSIPAELGDLANLEFLYLDGNRLKGSIPAEFGNLTKLRHLYLRGNRLEGCIPSAIKDLPQLRWRRRLATQVGPALVRSGIVSPPKEQRRQPLSLDREPSITPHHHPV